MNFLKVESNGIVMQLKLMKSFLGFKIKVARILDFEEVDIKFVGISEFPVSNQKEFEKAIVGFKDGIFEVKGKQNYYNDSEKKDLDKIDLAESCEKNLDRFKFNDERNFVFSNKSIDLTQIEKKSKLFQSFSINGKTKIAVSRSEKINVASLLQPIGFYSKFP